MAKNMTNTNLYQVIVGSSICSDVGWWLLSCHAERESRENAGTAFSGMASCGCCGVSWASVHTVH